MKIAFDDVEVSRSAKFERKKFYIGNTAVILGILRGKLYSNPIRAFTQELMCNARDAHREIGKEDTPIKVKLPSKFDQQFYVRDFGPGITPDRMEKVFIAYGESTKRSDDSQTGGFGIGAKSPWAYTDSFCIDTWTPEDGKMIHRSYVSVIDETKQGELNLINEEESNDPQGTMITVACKPNDEAKFAQWVQSATQFWDTRPEITGATGFAWPEYEAMFEGKNGIWKIYEKTDTYGYTGYSYGRQKVEPQAVIDGVPYPLNWDNLQIESIGLKYQNMVQSLWYYPVRFFFDTGELPITASREEIDYTPSAVARIQKEICNMLDELQLLVSEKIKNAKNLWEANLLWKKVRNEFSGIVNTVKWNGKDITGDSPKLHGHHISIFHYRRKDGNSFRKSHGYNSFEISDTSKLIINDEVGVAEPRRSRLKTIFINNPTVHTIDVLDLPEGAAERTDALDFLKDTEIDLYDPTYLTTVEKAKTVRTGGGGSAGKQTRIYEFTGEKYYKRDEWEKSDEDLEDGEGFYVLLDNKKPYLEMTNSKGTKFSYSFSSRDLETIKNMFKITIYGVVKRYVDKLGSDWVSLENKLKEKKIELENDPAIQSYQDAQEEKEYKAPNKMYHLWNAISSSWKNKIEDKDCVFCKYLEASASVAKDDSKVNDLNNLKRMLQDFSDIKSKAKNNKNLKSLYKDTIDKYPVLEIIEPYKAGYKIAQTIFDYINMVNKVDSQKEIEEEANDKMVVAVDASFAVSEAVPANA